MLDHYTPYTPWRWTPTEPGQPLTLAGGLLVSTHPLGAKTPRYVDHPVASESWVSAYRIEDPVTGGALLYAPCFGAWSPVLDELLSAVDCALLDGTVHAPDEMDLQVRALRGHESQRTQSHLPVSGPDGSLAALARHPGVRRIYTHLNNTNPLLDPDSAASAEVREAGVEILPDGTELTL
jgi:pyrroloquinoline quinone biosynthesis protein B